MPATIAPPPESDLPQSMLQAARYGGKENGKAEAASEATPPRIRPTPPDMQALVGRVVANYFKSQQDETRIVAEREKKRQAELASEPEDVAFPETNGLEEQARHAMRIVTAVRLALYGSEMMEADERHTLAGLLWGAEELFEKLDLEGVGLDRERARREAEEAVSRKPKAA